MDQIRRRPSERARIHEQTNSKVSNGQIRYVKQTEILAHATHVDGWEVGTNRLHELHESKFPFVSGIEFIRSKLSNFSAHVYGVTVHDHQSTRLLITPGRST